MITEMMQQQILQGMRAMRIASQSAFMPACRKFDLTFQQFTVLMELSHSPGLTAGELSDRVCILRTNFAAVANKLGQRGLICQKKSATDRRYSVLYLTEKGEELTREVEQWMDDRYGSLFEGESQELVDSMCKGFEVMEHFALKMECMNKKLQMEEADRDLLRESM